MTLQEAARSLQQQLAQAQAALAEGRPDSLLLEEKVASYRQEAELLRRQNELLQASEATFEREAALVR